MRFGYARECRRSPAHEAAESHGVALDECRQLPGDLVRNLVQSEREQLSAQVALQVLAQVIRMLVLLW